MSRHTFLESFELSRWKSLAGIVLVAALIWWLYPPRQLGEPPGKGVVEITFMAPAGEISDMSDAIKAFEAQSRAAHAKDPSKPIYRVVTGQMASRSITSDPTRFLLSVAGDQPPDVMYFDRYALSEWAARGAFEPLDHFIARDRKAGRTDYPHKSRYYPVCWNESIYHGRVYGVPLGVDTRPFFYNKDLFVRAGLVYQSGPKKGQAKPPRTWKELKADALRLSQWRDKAHQRLKVVGFAPLLGNSFLYMYGWLNGGKFITDHGHKCTLNDPKIVGALEWMKSVYQELGGYENVQAFAAGFGSDALDPFISGKVAMKIDWYGNIQKIANYGPDVNFGVAAPPMPASEIAKLSPYRQKHHLTLSWSGGFALAIPKRAKNQKGAWALIRFLTSDRGIRLTVKSHREMTLAQGHVFLPRLCPVIKLNHEFYRKYVTDNPSLPKRFKEAMKECVDLLAYSKYRPVTPVGQQLWNAQVDATESALAGESAKKALDYQTARIQHALDTFYAPPKGALIHSWWWFFVLYGIIIFIVAALAYAWDTNVKMRRRVGKLMFWREPGGDGVIEGAGGGYMRRRWREGWICISPWLIGFIILSGGPMLFSAVMSLCHFDVINQPRFVGLDNYKQMFGNDPLFYKSLWNTAFMALGVPVGMAVGLAISLLLNLNIRGMAVWRTFFYLPAIVPVVATSILWIWIFNPESGLINMLLGDFGIQGPRWLQDPAWAKPAIIIMGLWGAGSSMIIWLAGLKGIPEALYESASIDGANAWQRFCNVTLPQLTPYIFFNLVMGLIATFQIFAQAFIMTSGGPNNATLFYVYDLFNNAFRFGKMGYACAMAWVLVIIVMLLTIIQLKLSKRWVHYTGD